MSEHQPVLLQETLDALRLRPDAICVDATFGRGGHAAAILSCLGPAGRLLVMDRDPEAIAVAQQAYENDKRVTIVQDTFSNALQISARLGWQGKVDGLLLDVGVSSPQLEQSQRGFSFMNDGPLDMRMDPGCGESAASWLARARESEIADVIRRLGEERFYYRIAGAIVAARAQTPITRTRQLADIVADVVPVHEPGRHPATKVFQALRIHINDELGQLSKALENSLQMLAPGGRLCVISFHSLEDRIVKRFMRSHSLVDPMWRGMPDIPAHAQAALSRPSRRVKPGADEVSRNPRSRSAVLRVARRAA